MARSATDVMQDIVYTAILDAVEALRKASRGVPNSMLRDLSSLHANTVLADASPELQAAVHASVRAAFTRLQREGYSVAGSVSAPQRQQQIVRTSLSSPSPRPRSPVGDRPKPNGPRPSGNKRGPKPGSKIS